MQFQAGNQYAKNGKTGRPRKDLKIYQAEIGLKVILPYLKETQAVPKALENIVDLVKTPREKLSITQRNEQLKWSAWMLDKFLPTLQDIDLDADMKLDYGEKINAVVAGIFARLQGTGNNPAGSGGSVPGTVQTTP